MKIFTNLDLQGLTLANALLNPLAVAPATFAAGEVYYDTAAAVLRLGNGTGYDSLVKTVAGAGVVAIDASVEGVATISVPDADAVNPGLMTAAGFTLVNNATALATADTIAIRDANGNLVVATPTAADHAVTKAYVDQLTASGMSIVGALDGTLNPDYPAATIGEAYKINGDGFIGGVSGEAVENGDVVLALATNAGGDHATVGTDWLVLQGNVDKATTAVAGLVTLANGPTDWYVGGVWDVATALAETTNVTTVADATDIAMNVSSDTATALTTYIDAQIANVNANVSGLVYNEVMPAAALTLDVDHNLDATTIVEVYEHATGETVMTNVTRPTTNRVTVTHSILSPVPLIVSIVATGAQPAVPAV